MVIIMDCKDLEIEAVPDDLLLGQNMALAHKHVGKTPRELLLELFLVMRKEEYTSIIKKVDAILINAMESNDVELIIDLIKLIFYIRDPRKGKGEKDIFYYSFTHLWNNLPETMTTALKYIGQFGYWKDYLQIYNKCNLIPDQKNYIVNIYVEQLIKDYNELLKGGKNISLAGKWAPRESSKNRELARLLAKNIFRSGRNDWKYKQYRLLVSKLNNHLNTVEVKMCGKHFSDINPALVPSKALNIYNKALLDEKVINKKKPNKTKLRRHEPEDPDYEDRNKCRENFQNHVKTGNKLQSSVVELHTIIEKYLNDEPENIIYESQWKSRVEELRRTITKCTMFPLVDLSSSMNGKPMGVAITLGLFLSELMDTDDIIDNPFANKFLTFNTVPDIVQLPSSRKSNISLKTRVSKFKEWSNNGKWGGSTNITKAIELILRIAVDNKVPVDKMPEILAIFSDMQFDVADDSWNETSYNGIRKQYLDAGYNMPKVIFWNLRSNTAGYQVQANNINTCMVSGYSTRMMDLFLENRLEEMINTLTPMGIMNTAISHERFNTLEAELQNALKLDLNDFNII